MMKVVIRRKIPDPVIVITKPIESAVKPDNAKHATLNTCIYAFVAL